MGRIGSGVRVIVAFMSVFNKNTGRVLSYGVLRHEKGGGYDLRRLCPGG